MQKKKFPRVLVLQAISQISNRKQDSRKWCKSISSHCRVYQKADNSKGRYLQSKQSKASVVRKEAGRCRFGLADRPLRRHSFPLLLNGHRKDKPQFKWGSGLPTLYSHYKFKNKCNKQSHEYFPDQSGNGHFTLLYNGFLGTLFILFLRTEAFHLALKVHISSKVEVH